MGELSRPIMTPLGVVYRCICYDQSEAVRYGEWAVKTFGGQSSTSAFHQFGPNQKGFYEPGVIATVPANAKCVKKAENTDSTDWYATPEQAHVLVDATSTPFALFFDQRGLLLKPNEDPPLTAYCIVPI